MIYDLEEHTMVFQVQILAIVRKCWLLGWRSKLPYHFISRHFVGSCRGRILLLFFTWGAVGSTRFSVMLVQLSIVTIVKLRHLLLMLCWWLFAFVSIFTVRMLCILPLLWGMLVILGCSSCLGGCLFSGKMHFALSFCLVYHHLICLVCILSSLLLLSTTMMSNSWRILTCLSLIILLTIPTLLYRLS